MNHYFDAIFYIKPAVDVWVTSFVVSRIRKERTDKHTGRINKINVLQEIRCSLDVLLQLISTKHSRV